MAISTVGPAGLQYQTGTGPAFRAHNNSSQALSANTWTKVQFQVEDFDTASCFDNATNYRFTPNVAGYYQVNGSVSTNYIGSNGTSTATAIYKNGTLYSVGGNSHGTNTGPYGAIGVSDLIYLNGTTDYIEVYVITNNGSPYIESSATNTVFSASLTRAA